MYNHWNAHIYFTSLAVDVDIGTVHFILFLQFIQHIVVCCDHQKERLSLVFTRVQVKIVIYADRLEVSIYISYHWREVYDVPQQQTIKLNF